MAFASGICEADAGSAAKGFRVWFGLGLLNPIARTLAKDQTEQLYE